MTATRSDYRRAWQLAWPIILSNSSIPLVGAVDTAVMGHLPDPAFIGAVALGAGLFSVLYWGFGFLRMGTTGFVAQALGADDGAEAKAALHRALLIGGVLGLGLWLMQIPIAWLAFSFIEGSDQVETLTRTYFDWRIWSAPAVLANYALLGTLIGMQRTGSVLILQLVLNFTNVALDLLFVPIMGFGVEGVAVASVIAEYTAVAVGLLLVHRHLYALCGNARRVPLLEAGTLRALFAVNGNIFVRTLCLVLSLFWFTVLGTRLGETYVAANAILLQLQYFLAYGLDGFAHAVEGLAGSARGARNRHRFRAAIEATTICALCVALGYSVAFAFLGHVFIGWMTDLQSVRDLAATYLPWMILAPLVSIWSFQLDGIFIGITRTVEMRNGMVIATLGYLAAAELLVPLLHNHGLWLALMLFLGLRAITLALWLPRIDRDVERA